MDLRYRWSALAVLATRVICRFLRKCGLVERAVGTEWNGSFGKGSVGLAVDSHHCRSADLQSEHAEERNAMHAVLRSVGVFHSTDRIRIRTRDWSRTRTEVRHRSRIQIQMSCFTSLLWMMLRRARSSISYVFNKLKKVFTDVFILWVWFSDRHIVCSLFESL